MRYEDLPQIYKNALKKADLFELYEQHQKGESAIQLDEDAEDTIASAIMDCFYKAVHAIGLDGPDDSQLTAYIVFHNDSSDRAVSFDINGEFLFCVYGCEKYGNKAYRVLEEAIENYNYKDFSVENLYQPDNTFGISFNGIYQNEDMIYIGGEYFSDNYEIDSILPTFKLYEDVSITFADEYYVNADLRGPYGIERGEELLTYLLNNDREQLISLFNVQNVNIETYEDGVTEYTVTLSFINPDLTKEYAYYYDPELNEKPLDEETAINMAYEDALEDLYFPFSL